MIEPNIYCKVSGMVMEAICRLNHDGCPRPTAIEVGTAEGNGTQRYAGFCDLVIGVDAMASGRPDIVSNSEEPLQVDADKRASFERKMADFAAVNSRGGGEHGHVKLVVGSSTWPSTVAAVKEHLDRAGLLADILIVDGCHHPEEAVWLDFELYAPLVRPGGYVVFDDLYEDCILACYERAQRELGYVEVDRWCVRDEHILQECGLLRKPL